MMKNLPTYVKFSKNPAKDLLRVLNKLRPDKIGVLVDENTKAMCLDKINLGEDVVVIQIQSGEAAKNLQTSGRIWTELTVAQFTRKSVLINLGGGVIGDMGGFVAGTYKRGIPFINIPTTLLSQVDASIGGKLGVDFDGLKNHIGIFKEPTSVLIWDGFLKTLPDRELRSGFAEVIKHGLIWDRSYWQKIKKTDLSKNVNWYPIVKKSVNIKHAVVKSDPMESGLRKILNFGHTLGHAIESWYLDQPETLLHGESIAAGMIMEAHLSHMRSKLSSQQNDQIAGFLIEIYGKLGKLPEIETLLTLARQDKKNESGQIRYSLLEEIGKCGFDKTVKDSDVNSALEYYKSL